MHGSKCLDLSNIFNGTTVCDNISIFQVFNQTIKGHQNHETLINLLTSIQVIAPANVISDENFQTNQLKQSPNHALVKF